MSRPVTVVCLLRTTNRLKELRTGSGTNVSREGKSLEDSSPKDGTRRGPPSVRRLCRRLETEQTFGKGGGTQDLGLEQDRGTQTQGWVFYTGGGSEEVLVPVDTRVSVSGVTDLGTGRGSGNRPGTVYDCL